MKIRTLPVYSKLADDVPTELVQRLPDGWQLSQHQVETYRALVDPNGPEVIFNTAMTGDGKSLAGQLPSLVSGWRHSLFAMYPTNELIRDQLRQAEQTWSIWNQQPSIRPLDSAVLDRILEPKDFSQRGDALLSVLRNSEVVLTNPDIFHYIMQAFYLRKGKTGDATDRIIGPLLAHFNQFTFDEFHIFATPQIVSVLNAMLLIFEMMGSQRRRFLFQSATPNELMLTYLTRAGLQHQTVVGEYTHSTQPPDGKKWRRILQASDIYFHPGTVEEWIEAYLDDILLPFFKRNTPAAKGAIIVNSVAQAKRLVARLQPVLALFGLNVGENTGLTSRTQRAASYSCDLLIGTSTVDVGVDFQINFLLFESRDAGSFLQRLGRLGRHAGYERDGQHISFGEQFEAHAVLPNWILEALFQGQAGGPAPLVNEMETDREALIQAINGAFPTAADFAHYAQQWGGLQSARVIMELGNYTVRGQYEELRKTLAQRYQTAFRINLGYQAKRYKELHQGQKVLLEEAISFRGGSYFTCGVLDLTEEGADQIKTYDLFALIGNGVLDELTEEEFWRAVGRCGLKPKPFERQSPIAFFRLHGFRTERTNYTVKLQSDLESWSAERFGVATVLRGITVDTEFAHEVPGLNGINRRLEKLPLPALVCAGHHPLDLKRRLRLPLLFPLYAFASRDGVTGAIAFGREALLMEVALKHRGIDCGGQSIIL